MSQRKKLRTKPKQSYEWAHNGEQAIAQKSNAVAAHSSFHGLAELSNSRENIPPKNKWRHLESLTSFY
jgi:hypothetical protein